MRLSGPSRPIHHTQKRRRWLMAAAAFVCVQLLPAQAEVGSDSTRAQPEIAIIIDDMGTRRGADQRVIALPGPVACAFLPYGPYSADLARQAHAQHKEVMLHLPMESMERGPLDAGALRLEMTEPEFVATVQSDLARIPHVRGINNHMGSLLTRHPGHMLWLMQVLQRQGNLFFVDSRTTKHTVAQLIAHEMAVPSVSRDVFLDADPSPQAIRNEFRRLLALARRNGSALGIGHPHAGTLAVLERELPKLADQGVKLVPVARLVERRDEREPIWRASLFP